MKLLFAVILFVVLVGFLVIFFWLMSNMYSMTYHIMALTSAEDSIVLKQVYTFKQNTTYIIYHSGTSLLMTVESGGDPTMAKLVVEPGTCISIVPEKLEINRSIVVCGKTLLVEPGKYYVELLPTEPVSSTVNADLSWLPLALTIVVLFILALYIAYVYRR